MPPHPLTNFEIQKYNNIIIINQDIVVFILEIIYPKEMDGTYVINLDEYSDIGTQ